MISEYSNFHDGNRSTMFLSARSTRLAIAEAAAFRSAYTWNMEGPFYERLMANDPKARETWQAIAQYNGFLAEHEDLYRDAHDVAPVVVDLPKSSRLGFSWNEDASGQLDALSKSSALYRVTLSPGDTLMIRDRDAAPSVAIQGADHVIANVTRVGGKLVIHLLNYGQKAASGIRVRLKLDNESAGAPRMFTPDAATRGLTGQDLEFKLDTLDTYAVIVL